MTKIANVASVMIICLCALGIILITYWLTWPYKVMTIHEVRVTTPIVKSGDMVGVYLNVTKHMSISANVKRMVMNDYAWPMPSFDSDSPIGHTSWTLSLKLQPNMPDGKNYRIRTVYTYKVNPLRDVTVEWETPEFEVRNGDSGKT